MERLTHEIREELDSIDFEEIDLNDLTPVRVTIGQPAQERYRDELKTERIPDDVLSNLREKSRHEPGRRR